MHSNVNPGLIYHVEIVYPPNGDNLLLKWTQPKLGFVETVPRQALRSGACQVDPTKKKRKKHRDPVDV